MLRMKITRIIAICGIFFIATVGYAQQGLTEKDQKKIVKADEKLEKAKTVVNKNAKYVSEIEALTNDGRVRTRKIQRLETKANIIVLKSSSLYKDGYGKKFGAYEKAVSRDMKAGVLTGDAANYKNMAHEAYKVGRKWRRKSQRQTDVGKGVEYLYKANSIEADAIKNLIKALGGSAEEALAVVIDTLDSQAIMQDSISAIVPAEVIEEQVDTIVAEEMVVEVPMVIDSVSVADSLVVEAPVAEEDELIAAIVPEQNEVVTENNIAIYFTVQFLAEKQPVTAEKIKDLYDGSYEVVKHEADGWFRYSFGKFKSVGEAKEMLSKSGVSGYVVAYYNNERISTRRAIELMTAEY